MEKNITILLTLSINIILLKCSLSKDMHTEFPKKFKDNTNELYGEFANLNILSKLYTIYSLNCF